MKEPTPVPLARAFTAVPLGLLLAIPLAAGPLACADLETVSPVTTTTTTDTTTTDTTPTTTTTTAPVFPVVPERTMMVRSPLGGPANNLLADGDFELSSAYFGGGQYGFRSFSSTGTSELPMLVETGGLCRSGLTCAKIEKGQLLFGTGTAAPAGKTHMLSMYAKVPPEVPCNKITPLAVTCSTFDVLAKADPDSDFSEDWCHYSTTFKASDAAVCLYIQNALQPDAVALLDAAVLGPEDGSVPYKSTPAAKYTPDPDTAERLLRIRDLVRRTTPFGKKPSTRLPVSAK